MSSNEMKVYRGRNVANEYELSQEKAEIARALSEFLADSYVLYLKTQAFHWNVVGSHFLSLHKLFEEQYKNLALAIDECAERIRALGFKAPGSFSEFLQLTSLKEEVNSASLSDREMVAALVNDHRTLGQKASERLASASKKSDSVTSDFLTQRQKYHENARWMLDSLLERPEDLGLPPQGIV